MTSIVRGWWNTLTCRGSSPEEEDKDHATLGSMTQNVAVVQPALKLNIDLIQQTGTDSLQEQLDTAKAVADSLVVPPESDADVAGENMARYVQEVVDEESALELQKKEENAKRNTTIATQYNISADKGATVNLTMNNMFSGTNFPSSPSGNQVATPSTNLLKRKLKTWSYTDDDDNRGYSSLVPDRSYTGTPDELAEKFYEDCRNWDDYLWKNEKNKKKLMAGYCPTGAICIFFNPLNPDTTIDVYDPEGIETKIRDWDDIKRYTSDSAAFQRAIRNSPRNVMDFFFHILNNPDAAHPGAWQLVPVPR